MRLEVRCCCQPTKLLGYFDATPSEISYGYVRRPRLQSVADYIGSADFTKAVKVDQVELPIQTIRLDGKTFRAVKAEGKTLAELKLMFGFEEKRS